MRLPIVGVMGSGNEEYSERAEQLGAWLAGQGVHLLTGGGGGVMTSVSRGFHGVGDRRGRVIGILPGSEQGAPKAGYPNSFVEIPIQTHLPLSGVEGESTRSRNSINILTADVIVALPGGAGTASETRLALRHEKPLIAWLESRTQIPGLDPEIPVTAVFAEVKEFVREVLDFRCMWT
ncbi:MAG: DNA-binding protein [Pseudomonadota bacterium]|nr:DNA-binding protein [Pseudomonadota bacterium]